MSAQEHFIGAAGWNRCELGNGRHGAPTPDRSIPIGNADSSSSRLMSPRPPICQQDLELVAEMTGALWDELRGQHLFITGGTGFFGCWLVESFCFVNRLLSLNSRATILTRNPRAFAQKCPHLASDSAITLLEGDVCSFAFPGGEYRSVIHAATETSAQQTPEAQREMLSTIIGGTERTLEFAVSHGARRFLLTSSGAVYGKQPPDVTHVAESYAGAPNSLDRPSVYGEGKRTSELLCALY